jgi:ribonuclease J
MYGIDLVIPDFTFLAQNRSKILGIVITHGHEDHIGGIAYLLKHVNFPLYGTKLTLALVEGKLKEHGLLNKTTLTVQKEGDIVQLGCMKAEFINVNHSVPDACAIALHTPAGIIVHTGDFKIDYTPIRGPVINLARFGELGSQGVLALMSDSTNAERPGATPSERTVGDSFDKLFQSAATKRILVATFSSNVHRMQQIIDAAVKYKRKVAVFGRSMENVVGKALEIGYLEIPSGVLVDMDAIDKYPGDRMVIITTGSQGEPMSALTRMAMGDHRRVTVTENDCIIISASPIPGNEKLVGNVINELMKLGAQVVYEKMYEIHVSGHACRDEQKMMISLTRPKFFIPVHGEYKHLKKHADLAVSMGIAPENVFIGENGRVLVTDGDTMGYDGAVTAGKVLVDGLGVGDVGSVVLRDRKHLAEDGLIIVVTAIDGESGNILAGPDIISRGFVYVKESEDMMAKVRAIAKDTITKCISGGTREWGVIKTKIKDDVGNFLWQRTKRNPMVLPVVQEVR